MCYVEARAGAISNNVESNVESVMRNLMHWKEVQRGENLLCNPSASRVEKLRYFEATWHEVLRPDGTMLRSLRLSWWRRLAAVWLRRPFWCQRGCFKSIIGAKGVALMPFWCQTGFIHSLIH